MKTLLEQEQIKQNKKIYLRILQENEKIQKKIISDNSAENSDKFIPLISISHSENKSIEDNEIHPSNKPCKLVTLDIFQFFRGDIFDKF